MISVKGLYKQFGELEVLKGIDLEIGKGNKGDVYVKFLRNAKSEEVFDRWISRCRNK